MSPGPWTARPVVLMNGLPGSGKSTLAARLATTLGLPLFGRDLIKETLAEVLGHDATDGRPRRAWNAALGATSAETIWTLLSYAYSGAVAESNFSTAPELTRAGLRRAGVHRPLEIWCDVPIDLARQRYQARQPSRHPIHRDPSQGPEAHDDWWTRQDRPLGIGPVLRVDTSTAVNIAEVVRWCQNQRCDSA